MIWTTTAIWTWSLPASTARPRSCGIDGDLTFTPEPLDDRFGRGVAIVDVDADGWNDIVFTHRGLDGVTYWRNQGGDNVRPSPLAPRPSFERQSLPGVDSYAYAMAWGDVDGDGDLDLVTGSYGVRVAAARHRPAGGRPARPASCSTCSRTAFGRRRC